jgi:hypothetical protein
MIAAQFPGFEEGQIIYIPSGVTLFKRNIQAPNYMAPGQKKLEDIFYAPSKVTTIPIYGMFMKRHKTYGSVVTSDGEYYVQMHQIYHVKEEEE